MTPAFEAALARTLEHEGGYAHHPLDRGGPTNRGITQRTYDTWRDTTGKAKRPVEFIDDEEVREIYHADYWKPCACDNLPPRLAAAVFDFAVNSGVWNAKTALQRALRVRTDGVIGPVTIATASGTPDAVLLLLEERAEHIAEIVQQRPGQAVFLNGWMRRLLRQAWSAT